jgi:hypothetical protein
MVVPHPEFVLYPLTQRLTCLPRFSSPLFGKRYELMIAPSICTTSEVEEQPLPKRTTAQRIGVAMVAREKVVDTILVPDIVPDLGWISSPRADAIGVRVAQ